MKKQRRRWLSALLVVAMLAVSMFTDAGVMAEAATSNAITSIRIANLPEDGILKLEDETYDFNSKIVKKENSKEKSTGVVYWEVKKDTDTAGVQSSYTGVVYPTMAGEFEIRVLAFRTKSDRTKWLNARKANGNVADPKAEKYVTASSDWEKITVTSEEEGLAYARTQYRLNKLLKNKNVSHIVIRTDSEREFTIGSKKYLTKTLTVNAPNSEVINAGRFAQINVEQIKESTFHEKAKGNKFLFTAPNARFIVEKNARVAGLMFAPDMEKNPGAKMDVVVEGTIQDFKLEPKNQGNLGIKDRIPEVTLNAGANASVYGVTVSAASNVSIVGESQSSTKVTVEESAQGTTLNAQVPVKAELKASVEVVLGKDAKKSVLNILKAIEMLLTGGAENVTIKVDKEAEGAKVKTETKVEVQASADISLELGAGSEGTSVVVKDTEVKVDVENNTTEDIEITDNAGNVVGTVGSGSDEQVAVTPVPQPTTTPGTGSGSGGGTTTPSTPAPTPTPKPEEPGETPTPTPGEPEEPGETPTPTPGEPEEPGETPTPTPTTGEPEEPGETPTPTPTPGEPEEPGETPTPTPTPGEPEEPGEVVASITGVTANIVSGSAITTVSGSAVSVTNDMIKTDNGTVRVEPAITRGSIQVQLTFTAKATIDGTEAKDGVTYTWTVDGKTEETESGSYTATVTLSAGTTVAYSVKAAKIADSGTDPAS